MKMNTTIILVLVALAIGGVVAYSSFSGNKDSLMENEAMEKTSALDAEGEVMEADIDAIEEDSEVLEGDSMLCFGKLENMKTLITQKRRRNSKKKTNKNG